MKESRTFEQKVLVGFVVVVIAIAVLMALEALAMRAGFDQIFEVSRRLMRIK